MKYLKYLLFLFAVVYSECPQIFYKELLIKLRDDYGQCVFVSRNDVDSCEKYFKSFEWKPMYGEFAFDKKEGFFKDFKWKFIITDSLGGFAVFSNSYVVIQKNFLGNTLYFYEDGSNDFLTAKHLCFDKNGTYSYEYYKKNEYSCEGLNIPNLKSKLGLDTLSSASSWILCRIHETFNGALYNK